MVVSIAQVTTTDAPGSSTFYEYQVGYDDHRRINGIANTLETPTRGVETIADYSFTHDDNGNPLPQTVAAGLPDFMGDDRTFGVDRLDRLTGTWYNETGMTEVSILGLIGNRESHTDRAGTTTTYGPVNPANEYADVGGTPVSYDDAGNLAVDEDGRQYFYDEKNRLIEIQDSGRATLANYTYDALGRRVTATIDGTTTRYYYDGHSVIEERDATDTLVRYHVNGAQSIDERVATYEAAGTLRAPGFTYYLHNDNYSIAGTGSPDGSVIDRLNFSATGDFDDGDPGASSYYHDADADIDLDLADFASFQTCFGQTTTACLDDHDFDTDGISDGQIDLGDHARFVECFAGPFVTPSQACGRPSLRGAPPPSGTFALHGRPVDVLSDGHTLFDMRARYYPAKHGRWLQRDPTGYTDGGNLYESFGGNALSNTDPMGRQAVGSSILDLDGADIPTRLKRFMQSLLIPEKRAQAAATPVPSIVISNPMLLDPEALQQSTAAFQERLEVFHTEMGPVLVRGSAVIGIVGGVAEIAEGTLLIVYSEGLGAWIGVPIVAHGVDVTVASFDQLMTGGITETATYQLIASTGHPYIARTVDIGIPIGGAATAFVRAPRVLRGGRALTALRATGRTGAEITVPLRRLDQAGTGLTRARTWQWGDLRPGTLGATDSFGNITIRKGLRGQALRETIRHESVHRFLSPRSGPLQVLRANLRMSGYQRSHFLRYVEEAAAETYGTGSLRRGLTFPLGGGYRLSPVRVAAEGAAYIGGTAGGSYLVYELVGE